MLERREGPGLETSFANGGQISADHAAPWAKPGVPLQALKWLLQEDAPLLFRLRADPAQWRWGLQFLRNCTAARFQANAARLRRLGQYSRTQLRALRAETGIQYDHLSRGILVLYTGERGFEPGWKTPDECVAIEPAVASMEPRLDGGRYYPEDESGDAYKFTAGAREALRGKGRANSNSASPSKAVPWKATRSQRSDEPAINSIGADAYVLALGSYSPLLARPLGIDLPIYPLKGYSVTMPVKDPAAAWTVSLSDEAHKLVLSRLGDRLRIAGTAELNGYNTEINKVRCEAIVRRAWNCFPKRATHAAPSTGRACGPLRRATCPASAARGIRTSSSTPATARSAGRTPAAPAASSPTSSAGASLKSKPATSDVLPWGSRSRGTKPCDGLATVEKALELHTGIGRGRFKELREIAPCPGFEDRGPDALRHRFHRQVADQEIGFALVQAPLEQPDVRENFPRPRAEHDLEVALRHRLRIARRRLAGESDDQNVPVERACDVKVH